MKLVPSRVERNLSAEAGGEGVLPHQILVKLAGGLRRPNILGLGRLDPLSLRFEAWMIGKKDNVLGYWSLIRLLEDRVREEINSLHDVFDYYYFANELLKIIIGYFSYVDYICIITLREFWAQPRITELNSSESLQFLSILSNFWPFIGSKLIQAYLSYNRYTLGQ